jgi:hypothetical protein
MSIATAIRTSPILLPLKRIWLQSVLSIQGLMQLLMKQRNGEPWTPEDRQEIRRHFRALRDLAPMLALFSLPGGTLLLPLLAWFLDRRHAKQRESLAAKERE